MDTTTLVTDGADLGLLRETGGLTTPDGIIVLHNRLEGVPGILEDGSSLRPSSSTIGSANSPNRRRNAMAYKQRTGIPVATQSVLTDDPDFLDASWSASFRRCAKRR